MLKRLFGLSPEPNYLPPASGTRSSPQAGARQTNSARESTANTAAEQPRLPSPQLRVVADGADRPAGWNLPATFQQVYESAAVKPLKTAVGILKVVDMVYSPHLNGMTPELKRGALMMALEAAGADFENLLQDAVARQRALNDCEGQLQDKLKQFEAAKEEENRQHQAELDRITSQYQARIKANLDEVARCQENFRTWQKRKQQESHRISEAAAFCVPQGNVMLNDSSGLTAVLERASAAHR